MLPRLSSRLAQILICCALPVGAFAQPELQITSPADGAAFGFGQTVTVNVRASGGTFRLVSLIPESPLHTDQFLTTPPFKFSIQLPSNLRARRYAITAVGVTTNGEPIYSDPIFLSIDRATPPPPSRLLLRRSRWRPAQWAISPFPRFARTAPSPSSVNLRGLHMLRTHPM